MTALRVLSGTHSYDVSNLLPIRYTEARPEGCASAGRDSAQSSHTNAPRARPQVASRRVPAGDARKAVICACTPCLRNGSVLAARIHPLGCFIIDHCPRGRHHGHEAHSAKRIIGEEAGGQGDGAIRGRGATTSSLRVLTAKPRRPVEIRPVHGGRRLHFVFVLVRVGTGRKPCPHPPCNHLCPMLHLPDTLTCTFTGTPTPLSSITPHRTNHRSVVVLCMSVFALPHPHPIRQLQDDASQRTHLAV